MDQYQSRGKPLTNFQRHWSIQILSESKAPRDWSTRVSPEIPLDQWLPDLFGSPGLHRHRSIECSSPDDGRWTKEGVGNLTDVIPRKTWFWNPVAWHVLQPPPLPWCHCSVFLARGFTTDQTRSSCGVQKFPRGCVSIPLATPDIIGQKNPRAHKNKIGVSAPSQKLIDPHLKRESLWA